eukprot:scaffold1058_cov163-Amphora_coffeaeformis.AAC.5
MALRYSPVSSDEEPDMAPSEQGSDLTSIVESFWKANLPSFFSPVSPRYTPRSGEEGPDTARYKQGFDLSRIAKSIRNGNIPFRFIAKTLALIGVLAAFTTVLYTSPRESQDVIVSSHHASTSVIPSNSSHATIANMTESNAVSASSEQYGEGKDGKNSVSTFKKVYYTPAHQDRSGAAISFMLQAHAYCFSNDCTYAGACGPHKPDGEQLIHDLGLAEELPFACPEEGTLTKDNTLSFHGDDGGYFVKEWRDYIYEKISLDDLNTDEDVLQIAVHVRRGDVSLCTDNAWKRYLPNSHYLRLIDSVLENVSQPYKVTIFSESEQLDRKSHKQYETFDDFVGRNYSLNLDTELADVWKAFVHADVLMTAKSTFSLAPARLRNHGRVIYTPFKRGKGLPEWEMVDDIFMAQTAKDMTRLQEERCPKRNLRTRNLRSFGESASRYIQSVLGLQ